MCWHVCRPTSILHDVTAFMTINDLMNVYFRHRQHYRHYSMIIDNVMINLITTAMTIILTNSDFRFLYSSLHLLANVRYYYFFFY